MVSFKVNITPKPAPRPRTVATPNGNVKIYMPNDYKEYIAEIQRQVYPYVLEYKSNELLVMDVIFRKNVPPRQKRFGDADNLLKGVMDALIGYAYFDDAQVIKASVTKIQSEDEGIDIKIGSFFEE